MQAETEAYITQKQADQQYLATLDKYAKFANLLKKAQSEMGFDANAALAYLSNSVVSACSSA
jgi:hypothetical protein